MGLPDSLSISDGSTGDTDNDPSFPKGASGLPEIEFIKVASIGFPVLESTALPSSTGSPVDGSIKEALMGYLETGFSFSELLTGLDVVGSRATAITGFLDDESIALSSSTGNPDEESTKAALIGSSDLGLTTSPSKIGLLVSGLVKAGTIGLPLSLFTAVDMGNGSLVSASAIHATIG